MTRLWLLGIVGLIAFASITSAQVPLPQALRKARFVYLEQGPGVTRAIMEKAAKEMQKYRPRRLELVGDKTQADVIFAVSSGTTRGGCWWPPCLAWGCSASLSKRRPMPST